MAFRKGFLGVWHFWSQLYSQKAYVFGSPIREWLRHDDSGPLRSDPADRWLSAQRHGTEARGKLWLRSALKSRGSSPPQATAENGGVISERHSTRQLSRRLMQISSMRDNIDKRWLSSCIYPWGQFRGFLRWELIRGEHSSGSAWLLVETNQVFRQNYNPYWPEKPNQTWTHMKEAYSTESHLVSWSYLFSTIFNSNLTLLALLSAHSIFSQLTSYLSLLTFTYIMSWLYISPHLTSYLLT